MSLTMDYPCNAPAPAVPADPVLDAGLLVDAEPGELDGMVGARGAFIPDGIYAETSEQGPSQRCVYRKETSPNPPS